MVIYGYIYIYIYILERGVTVRDHQTVVIYWLFIGVIYFGVVVL